MRGRVFKTSPSPQPPDPLEFRWSQGFPLTLDHWPTRTSFKGRLTAHTPKQNLSIQQRAGAYASTAQRKLSLLVDC